MLHIYKYILGPGPGPRLGTWDPGPGPGTRAGIQTRAGNLAGTRTRAGTRASYVAPGPVGPGPVRTRVNTIDPMIARRYINTYTSIN